MYYLKITAKTILGTKETNIHTAVENEIISRKCTKMSGRWGGFVLYKERELRQSLPLSSLSLADRGLELEL
jgi:hypothetical protein